MYEEDIFISLVEANRVLWDKKCDDYKNISLKDKIWEEIGQQCSLTGKEAAALFSSLRLKYIRRKNDEKNMQRSGSAAKLLKAWNLQEQLTFLDDTIVPRKTVSNLLKEKSVVLKNTASEGIDLYSNEPIQGCSGLYEDCNVSLASEDSLPIMSPPPTMDAQNRCITPVRTTPTPSTSGTSLSCTIVRKPTKRRHEMSQEVEHFCNFIGARFNELPKKKLRKAEALIMDVLNDVEEGED
ncbi:Mesoderm-expressed 2 [Carabus blaptoides fortunei]